MAETGEITTAGPGALFKLDAVRKVYEMGEVTVEALRGVSLTIEEDEFVALLGPSGSGKSTLLNLLGGLDSPTGGDIHFRDAPLSRYSESQRTQYRRKNIGFVFQFYNLMPSLTAEENVELATELSENPMSAREALDLVDLADRAKHFPSQLSGGEQQRVAIARAVTKRPDVLLCDEPTGALDISTGKVVLQALGGINERLGTALIVITHNAAIGGMADRVVRLQDGEVRDIVINQSRMPVEALEW